MNQIKPDLVLTVERSGRDYAVKHDGAVVSRDPIVVLAKQRAREIAGQLGYARVEFVSKLDQEV